MDEFGRAYLRLVLEIDEHVAGYVDAYYGPNDIKATVADTPRREPIALLDDVQQLQETVPQNDPARYAYLSVLLRSVECTVRLLAGERFPYLEEVERLYDVQPQPVNEALFTTAHEELTRLLPGRGPLAERVEARRQRYYLKQEQILPLLKLARNETRRRTAEFVDLPKDEAVEIRLASDQPWGAYNWYRGNGRSLIEFNTDVPTSALGLISTFAHEGYPGHHTEAIIKEQHLYRQQGYAEQAAMLLHSPAAVMAEGIATTAIEIIFPDDSHHGDSHHDWNADVLLPAAHLPKDVAARETADQMRRIAEAKRQLRYVTGNAAIRYHRDGLTQEETIDYIRTYGLATEERAQKSFRFLSHPLFRSYVFTYTQGYDLITEAAGEQKRPLFRRLLSEQLLPSQLKAMKTGFSEKFCGY